ncbi:MAG: hypothetical protein JWM49_1183 [Microbacteriaceae bacterium]|nr:hypothetical protein [Microbacteriaceae bacterium]
MSAALAGQATTTVRSGLRAVVSSPVLLWTAFVLAHLWLGYLNLYAPGYPLGDLTVYKFWVDEAINAHTVVGIDVPWVYPIVAFVPMLLANLFGADLYAGTWLSLVFVLDVIAFGMLTGWGHNRRNIAVGWWWVGFLLLLGPIAFGRIDAISVPFGIVGVLLVATRPRAAAVILTIATWIKVWPAAIIAAILISVRARVRVAVAILVASLVIVGGVLAVGGGSNVFSFVTAQAARGLQVEAPVSTPWLWAARAGVPNTFAYFDQVMLTWQMRGPGVETASALATPLLALVMAVITVLGIFAVRNRVAVQDLLPSLALAYAVAFIAFNKVGSPQYLTWLAVPVILGLATNAAGRGRAFRVPAILAAVLAALTQVIYPYLYGYLLSLDVRMLVIITARNSLFFVLLGWALVAIVRASRESVDRAAEWRDSVRPADAAWLPPIWPFGSDRDTFDRGRLDVDEDELVR